MFIDSFGHHRPNIFVRNSSLGCCPLETMVDYSGRAPLSKRSLMDFWHSRMHLNHDNNSRHPIASTYYDGLRRLIPLIWQWNNTDLKLKKHVQNLHLSPADIIWMTRKRTKASMLVTNTKPQQMDEALNNLQEHSGELLKILWHYIDCRIQLEWTTSSHEHRSKKIQLSVSAETTLLSITDPQRLPNRRSFHVGSRF